MMCDDSLGELQSFAQRNRNVGRTVSSITLLADDDDEDIRLKWEPLFEMYPSVSRLHVQDKDPGRTLLVTEWLLDTLCRRLHDPLLPQLAHLSLLLFPVLMHRDVNCLDRFIETRAVHPPAGATRLEEIELGRIEPEFEQPIAGLRGKGVRVYAMEPAHFRRPGSIFEDDDCSSEEEEEEDDDEDER